MGCVYLEKYIKKKKLVNNQLAFKYCDSLKKNLFKGLDKEATLKYEYFFSSLPYDSIKDENKLIIKEKVKEDENIEPIVGVKKQA